MALFKAGEKQQMFDHVVKSLAIQGIKALECSEFGEEMVTVLKTRDGCKCSLGFLLSAVELFEMPRDSDARHVCPLFEQSPTEIARNQRRTFLAFLEGLQLAHDISNTRKNVRERLLDVAQFHELRAEVVETYMSATWCEGTWREMPT